MTRRAVWPTVAAVVFIALIGAAVWALLPRGDSAGQRAQWYLDALAAGDLKAVEATGVDVPEQTASAFLAADAYMEDVTIASVSESEGTALVEAEFTLAGERVHAQWELMLEQGRWVPAVSTLGAVIVDAGPGAGAIGDALLTREAEQPLLPAEYTITAAPSDYLQGSATVRVMPGSRQEVALKTELHPDAAARAAEQFDEYLATCTAPADQVPASCGIAIPSAGDIASVDGIRYRIEKAPVLSLDLGVFRADGGVLVATVYGTNTAGVETTMTYRTENWSLRGDVAFTGEDIVLSVW